MLISSKTAAPRRRYSRGACVIILSPAEFRLSIQASVVASHDLTRTDYVEFASIVAKVGRADKRGTIHACRPKCIHFDLGRAAAAWL
jgi:hypothetical protein